jgi:hypothetical protein
VLTTNSNFVGCSTGMSAGLGLSSNFWPSVGAALTPDAGSLLVAVTPWLISSGEL